MEYVYAVTVYDDNGAEPIVTIFDNEMAALMCSGYFGYDHRVCMDKVPVYKRFSSVKEAIDGS